MRCFQSATFRLLRLKKRCLFVVNSLITLFLEIIRYPISGIVFSYISTDSRGFLKKEVVTYLEDTGYCILDYLQKLNSKSENFCI